MVSDNLISKYKNKSMDAMIRSLEAVKKPCTPKDIHTIAMSCFGLYDGGIERVVTLLSNQFISAGYKVVLFTTDEPDEKDYAYSELVERVVVPKVGDVFERIKVLEARLSEYKVDVFIENLWTSPILIWECLLCNELKVPLVTYVHGNFSYQYSVSNDYCKFFHRVIRLSDAVVCLDMASEHFFKKVGCKCLRVDNPISPELLNLTRGGQCKKNRILWIGRIVEGKRFEDALRIVKEIKAKIPDVEMEVVGWGKLGKGMKKLAKQMGLAESVHFRGYQEQVYNYYFANKVLLMTSESEGYPLSLIEAKAAGVPVVMYNLPYLAVNQQSGGFLASSRGDIPSMANDVIRILKDEDLYKQMSLEAHASFEVLKRVDIISEWNKVFKMVFQNQDFNDSDLILIDLIAERYSNSFHRYEESSKEIKIGRLLLCIPRLLLKKR